MVGSSYTELPKELDNPKKGLINIQNINDNECFKWCLFRYLHDADHNPARIRKVDKDFARELDFHNITFPVKIRDIHKIKKKKNPLALVFLVMKTKKNIQSMCQKILSKDMLIYYQQEKKENKITIHDLCRF